MWGGFDQKRVQLWIPLDLSTGGPAAEQNNSFVYARLKPGTTVAAALAEMSSLQKRLAKSDPALSFFSGINLSPVAMEDAGPELRTTVWVLQAAVAFVLLIACANVANLVLTRAMAREREFAIRIAVGAGKLRLLRQMITEGLTLTSCASVIAMLLSIAGMRLVSSIAPPDTHGLHELRINGSVLLFTLTASFVSALLFGSAPYLHFRKQDLNEAMNRTSRSVSARSGRLRGALIIAEVALSMVLLVGAGLMIRTLAVLMSTHLGFQRDHLLSMQITLPDQRYKERVRVEDFNGRVLAAMRSLPGVQSAMLSSAIPMQSVAKTSFEFDGQKSKPGESPIASWARVSPQYFETLKMRVYTGRTFLDSDPTSGNAGVAVVNRSFAKAHAQGGNILGRVILFGGEDGKEAHYRIVGVVEDEHQLGPDVASLPEFYLPGHALKAFYLIMRTASEPLSLAAAAQTEIWKLDRNLPVANVKSMDAALREWTGPRRFVMTILVTFAALAIVLAGIGLFGVLAYSVSLRTREIGIRLALGAEPSRIGRIVVMDGCKLAFAGIVVGFCASLALVRFLQSLMFGVSPNDPFTLVLVPVLLSGIALLASYGPARRAARVDPVEALRAE